MDKDRGEMNGLAICAGIGGLELGLGMVVPDYRTVCAVEREAYSASVLVARQKDKALPPFPIWDDLTTFDGRPWRGIVDIVTGGIPCQPFSYAGKRKGGDDERNLWPQALRIVGEVRPAIAFFENVPGVEQYYFNSVWPELHQLGYEVAEGIFSAAEVGASHRRERIFILARLDDPQCQTALGRLEDLWMSEGNGYSPEHPSHVLAYARHGRGRTEQERQHDAVGRVQEPWGTSEGSDVGSMAHSRREQVNVLQRLHGAKPERTSDDVGNAEGGEQRLQRQYQRESPQSNRRPSSNVEHPSMVGGQPQADQWREPDSPGYVFPPNPDDLEVWSQVLAQMPSLEPAVCRVVTEFPNRVDRLAALGNAVIPLQAGHAFRTLWEKLTGQTSVLVQNS